MLKHVFSRIFQQPAVILTPATTISVPKPTLQRAIIEKSLPVPRKKRKVDIIKGIKNLFSLEKNQLRMKYLRMLELFLKSVKIIANQLKLKEHSMVIILNLRAMVLDMKMYCLLNISKIRLYFKGLINSV